MHVRLLVVALALPALLGAEIESKTGLKKFVSQVGRFSVLLPSKPQEQKVPIKDPNDPAAVQYLFAVERPNGAYLTSYQDNIKLEKADDKLLEQALTKAQKGAQAAVGGKILIERKLKLEGKYPGRDFTCEVPMGQGLYHSHIYMAKGRLYQVIVVGVKEFAESKEADQVLNSFKLLKE